MPHLDIFAYTTQVAWIFLGLIVLYLIYLNYVLPTTALALRARQLMATVITTNISTRPTFPLVRIKTNTRGTKTQPKTKKVPTTYVSNLWKLTC